MLEFISAIYNEEAELEDLISHVDPYVDLINLVDDGSTDQTGKILTHLSLYNPKVLAKRIDHTGLCEVGRIHALEMCKDDSWVVMLDADERFGEGVWEQIVEFVKDPPEGVTHVYFSQREFIDGKPVAEFAKVKLFKKSAAHLPEVIHRDPSFDGEGVGFNWLVIHRKSSEKQVMREVQYLETYEKLFEEGKVTRGDVDWFRSMHHYVRERRG